MTEWLIEDGIFPEYQEELLKLTNGRVIRRGMFHTDTLGLDQDDNSIFFYGSIDTAFALQRNGFGWQTWIDNRNFECRKWLSVFHHRCLNYAGYFIPYRLLEQHVKHMEGQCGDGTAFIRPDSGTKTFTGHKIHFSEVSRLGEDFTLFDDDMIFVAPALKTGLEYRFVIQSSLDGEARVVACSQYMHEGEECVSNNVPNSARLFVQEMLKVAEEKQYIPAPMWTMDVDVTGDIPSVIEVNSFSCAGLYHCNLEEVVKAVDESMAEWVVYAKFRTGK